jgi:CheY-like chemotaxis protein
MSGYTKKIKPFVSKSSVSVRIPKCLKKHAMNTCHKSDLSLSELFRQALAHECVKTVHAEFDSMSKLFPKPQPSLSETKMFKPMILLVDDNDIVRQSCRYVLESVGYMVLDADCGEKANALWLQHFNEICLLITDYDMPDMNGVQLYSVFHAAKPDMRAILISGTSRTSIPDALRFLKKPFSKADFVATVHQQVSLFGQAARG